MPNLLQKLPVLVYVPAVPGIPGRAAYCENVPSSGSATGIGGSIGSGSSGSYQPTGQIPPGWSGIQDPNGYGTSYSGNRPVSHTTKVCYPAVPGVAPVPARLDQRDNIGWNAGARSIAAVPEDGYFRCTLSYSPIGIQVGFSPRLFQAAYSLMRHSVVIRWAELTVVEAGQTVFGPVAVGGGETIELRRKNGVVSYLVDDVVVYESTQLSAGEVYGGVLLYSTSDFVDSPSVGALSDNEIAFTATLPAVRAAIGTENFTYVQGALPAVSLSATLGLYEYAQLTATLPALRAAIGTEDFTYVQGALPAITFRAEAGAPEEIPNNLVALLPVPRLNATLVVGQSVAFTATLPAVRAAIGTEDFTYVRGTLALRVVTSIVEPYLPADESDGSDAMFLADTAALESALVLVAHETLELDAGSAALTIILDLAVSDGISVSESASIGSIVELIAREELAVANTMTAARSQALQYAVNYLTGALVTYRQFDFDGFARSTRSTYAWRKDGLYKVGGATDDGDLIEALIDYSTTDFDDAHVKRVSTAYLGVRTDGQCYLRVTADEGRTRVYKVVGEKNVKRAQLAKGVTGRYWNVTLEIVDASFATVDSVEVEVGTTQRRGFNRRDW